MSDREKFELMFPVPEGVKWSDKINDYTCTELRGLNNCVSHCKAFKAWQAASAGQQAVSVPGSPLKDLAHEGCGGKAIGRARDGDVVTCEKCGKDGSVLVDDGGTEIEWISRPQPPKQAVSVPEADMFWDADNAEMSHEDEYELASDCAQDLPYGESMLIDVMCAKKLPTRQMKVWINDEEEGLQWEWVNRGEEGE